MLCLDLRPASLATLAASLCGPRQGPERALWMAVRRLTVPTEMVPLSSGAKIHVWAGWHVLWSSRGGGFLPLPAAGGPRCPLSCAPAQVSARPSCSPSPSQAAYGVGGGERELSPGVARVSSMWGPEDWSGGPVDAHRGLASMLPCWATLEVMSRLRASGTLLSKFWEAGLSWGASVRPGPASFCSLPRWAPLLARNHYGCTARGQAGGVWPWPLSHVSGP